MRDLVEYVAKSLADEPDEVRVEETSGQTVTLALAVAPGDLGRLIGRQGRTAKAIRTLLAARAKVEGKRALLEIEE